MNVRTSCLFSEVMEQAFQCHRKHGLHGKFPLATEEERSIQMQAR